MIEYEAVSDKDAKPCTSKSAIAGGISGAITRFALQPLDVLKTRFQLQVEPISRKCKTSKYRTILQAVRTISHEETFFAMWKGHVPAQILSIIYGATQFAAFEKITKTTSHVNPEYVHGTLIHFCCGGIATSVATLVSFPFDVIRTRFIAQGNIKAYRTMYDATHKMFMHAGYKAFFQGLTPAMIQSIPYEINTGTGAMIGNLTAGFMAGLCAKTIVYPFDVCRKRLQIQSFHDVRKNFGKAFVCNSVIDCCTRIYKEESLCGFYKGIQPALIKAASTTAFYFTL